MKIRFVTQGRADDCSSLFNKQNATDVVVFGPDGLGLVSYKKELDGDTERFRDVAKLSREINGVIISGCDTDSYGVFRHSAVIADRGKLLGVSDMAHSVDDSEFVSGGNFRVYDTSAGKIGIIVDRDLFFPESARVLALCDADVIICVFRKSENFMPQIMLRAGAFCNGVPIAMCTEKFACVSDIKGEMIFMKTAERSETEIIPQKDYHLISSRRRGLYRDFGSGY